MALPPKLWSNFSVNVDTGTFQFKIVEAPQERINDIVNLIMKYFATDEQVSKATGVPKSEEALARYRSWIELILKFPEARSLVCCADDGSNEIGEIIGASFIRLIEEEEVARNVQISSKVLQKFKEVVKEILAKYDVKAEHKISKYYDAKFVVVHPNYRGLGIARELLKSIPLICKEDSVPLTAGFMTAYGTQKAADKAGWATVFEISYEELGNKFDITFADDAPPTCKIMIARAENTI